MAAAAGDGAITGEDPPKVARRGLPEAMLRHEGSAAPDNLRILRAHGDSMEPLVGEGDRLIVDVSRRRPATGELAALWDGPGLVVKRVEAVAGMDGPVVGTDNGGAHFRTPGRRGTTTLDSG